MRIHSVQLINQLIQSTQSQINKVQDFRTLDTSQLNYRNSKDSWSILECIAHLNLYATYYINEINKKISVTPQLKESTVVFKSGILGNYFAKSMLPKERLNKMQTFKDMNPIHSQLDITTLETFITLHYQLLSILESAKKVNLNNIRIPISINRFIKLKLGDTFRFLLNHNERHLVQAHKLLK